VAENGLPGADFLQQVKKDRIFINRGWILIAGKTKLEVERQEWMHGNSLGQIYRQIAAGD
jgi:hypothetical protein